MSPSHSRGFKVFGLYVRFFGLIYLAVVGTSLGQETKSTKTFIDYFLPMPIADSLSKDVWGAAEVGPRDVKNGLEDTTMKQWCYWDGQIIKGPDGKYHMFASRWDQAKGHGEWVHSRAVHAVSDKVTGPYLDKGLCWPDDQGGKGHNVTALVLPDGRYAVVISETRPGTVFVSQSLDGPWKQFGAIKGDGLDASNISIMVRPDGDYMIVPRSGRVFVSKAADGILGPYKPMGPSVFATVLPGIPALEDPAIFYSGGLYHIVVNSWSTRKAYHLTSKDGKGNWVNRGLAYDPTTKSTRYTDGTVNHWHKLERPGVLLENGHVTAVTLAVLDTPKEQQPGNNGHGSKIIVIPFDGAALDRDLQNARAATPAASRTVSVATAEDRVTAVDRPDTTQKNDHYAGNRPPLLPSPLVKLPTGSIKPKGWLRKQLELEADGFTGHLTEISGFCHKEGNAWRSPYGEGGASWEEVPYWFRGYAALGYVLDDRKIIEEARPWLEAAITSQTDFGYFGPNANLNAPIHPAVPAEVFTTPDGKPGVAAEYYDGTDFKTLKLRRVDPNIDFDWGMKSPIEGLKSTDYSVRWTGRITVPTTGDYQFSLYSDDGAKLWIDNVLIVDNWGAHAPLTITAKKPLHLEAGKPHDLKVEYFQGINGAEVRLGWKKPGATYEARNIIPDLMPNMNMLYALRAYHEYTGDKRVIDLMTKYFHWELTIPDKIFFSGGWQVPRNGDNLDSVYWLYNRTGEPFLLELAAKLQRCGATWMGLVTGGHNVDFSQGFRKPALFYQQNHDPKFLEVTEKNWESIMGIYGQVPGGTFGGDEFARTGYTDPRQAIETCGCVEMMLSEMILARITGESKWADRCENAAFNTLPATMTADMKALRYLTSPNQVNSDKRSKAPELADGGPMQVMNPHDHRCCQHNAGAGWPSFADNLWQATPGNGLAAIFYCASTVKANVGGGVPVTIDEGTHYPFDGKVSFTLSMEQPVQFPLYLRVPGWCQNPRLAINGRSLDVQSKPGAYLRIDRRWQPGDRVELEMPMEVALTTWTANKNSVSVNRGPLTFSIKIGEQYRRAGGTDAWPAWEILPTTPWNYALSFDPQGLASSFRVVKKPWPANDMPFTHEGTPVEIQAWARKLPNWKEDHLGLVDKLQSSPVKCSEPVETVTLIPMGAARLRLSALPVIGSGPDAREWQLPPEPLMSYSRGGPDPYEAMFDGKVPKSSFDGSVPRFTTYCFGGAEHGKLHWVRRNFDQEKVVSSCEVYWFDESPVKGDVRLPKWWRVLYREGKEWKEVGQPSGYGIQRDKFNVVTFKPVKTTALKLEVQCRDEGGRYAMGIYEWQIKSDP